MVRTLVIVVTGALVILLAAGGLMEISSRDGPHEQTLAPVAVPLVLDGDYLARGPRGSVGPGGVCLPSAPGETCAPARVQVRLFVAGLPGIGPRGTYEVYLADDGEEWHLGALQLQGSLHRIDYAQDRDARSKSALILRMQADSPEAALEVLRIDVAGKGQQSSASLDAERDVRLIEGDGTVRLAEIGALGKSVVAVGEMRAPRLAGWTYAAWLVSNATGARAAMGMLEATDPTERPIPLDQRVERLRLEDQSQFLITIQPEKGSSTDPWPVLQASIRR